MKLSIVTTYFNRKKQFENTLTSILKSSEKDIEIIVTDDASDETERLENLLDIYPFLKIIRVESSDKYWVNPCIPFNKAIREATGDIIILQNPECFHKTDVLKFIVENISDTNYLVMPVFALSEEQTQYLNNGYSEFDVNTSAFGRENGWYHHPFHRPCYYHFCSAISKKNMDILKGFDERYAYGFGYDDDEFLRRIRQLGLSVVTDMSQLVYHQSHLSCWSGLTSPELVRKNQELFYN